VLGDHAIGWRGLALALIVAVSFAGTSVFAVLAYAGGSDPLSVLTARSIAAFVILHLVLGLRRIPRALPARQRNAALALGLLMAVYSYGLLGAIEYMPVALAVITFYTYPILVAVAGWLSGRESFQPRFALALIVAFAGLILALDLSAARPHPLGVSLALMAAIGLAVLLIVSERVRGDCDSRPITLHMLGTAMAAYVAVSAALGHLALPQTPSGWIGFVGAPLCYTFSIVFVFVVLSMIGPLRTALVMNIEPVASVVLGYLVLAQKLDALQLLGIAVVVGAVAFVEGSRSGDDAA
jgi:drug/metabolite transporter (DMT)-like permease